MPVTAAAAKQEEARVHGYRPDIDGLRAIAVLLVVLFHLDVAALPGGFIGVDVFFVISGFLITRLILSDIDRGEFSFKKFYLRRLRRLGPALIVVIAGTLIAGAAIMLPSHIVALARSALAALLCVSNFFFFWQSGYFDSEALTKPLLHTWSLGVEEQFYLVWPAVLAAVASARRKLALILGVAAIASLVLSILISAGHPDAAFYLPFTRVYELAAGAVLVLARPPGRSVVAQAAGVFGLASIAAAAVIFSTNLPFPSYLALLPCAGTAALIWSGPRTVTGGLLSAKWCVALGQRSYVLYLVHWPVIALYLYGKFEGLGGAEKMVLLATSIVLTEVIHRFIEQPIRSWRIEGASLVNLLRWTGAGSLASLALAVSLIATNGLAWRVPPYLRDANEKFDRAANYQINNTLGRSAFAGDGRPRVLIIGDSHQADLFNAFYENEDLFSRLDVRSQRLDAACFYLFAPHPSVPSGATAEQGVACEKEVAEFKASERVARANVLVISSRWTEPGVAALPAFAAWFAANRHAGLIALGRTMEFDDVPRLLLRHRESRPGALDIVLAVHRKRDVDNINAALAEAARTAELPFFRKDRWICPTDDRCSAVDAANNMTIYDYGHWTRAGARLFGSRMAASEFGSRLKTLSAAGRKAP